MTRSISIVESHGTRTIAASEFPISLGGPEATVELEGVGCSGTVAWLGLSESDLFVQAADAGQPISCNGSPVATSQWLHDGDVVRIGHSEIAVAIDGDIVRITVEHRAEENITEPPQLIRAETVASPGEGIPPTTIKPADFRPRRIAERPGPRRRLRPKALLLWTALLVVGGVAWLLFTTRSVAVLIEPEPDHIAFQGGLFAFEVGGRFVMRPGSYTLVAEKQGYRRLQTPVQITDETNQSLRFELEKLAGSVSIDTGEVRGASVRVDGRPVGQSPLQPLALAAGEHRLQVSAERYADFETTIAVEGAGVDQRVEVELVPLWAEITFRSRPSGASVEVEGRTVGKTPLTAELLEGRHRFVLRAQGFKPYFGSVEVEAERPRTLPVAELKPSDGKLVLLSEPAGATVTIDGTYRGQTPLELFLAPGRAHELTLNKSGHEPASRQVSLGSGESSRLVIELSAQLGEVRIEVEPADAELLVDGVVQPAADGTLRLVAVPHRIEIRREGYEPHTATITPRPGFPQALRVTLKTAEQLKAEKMPRVIRSPQGHEMVLIEGGRMRMGASRREPGRRANETLRNVELKRPFYLSTKEVSNREFREFQSQHLSGSIGGFNLEIDHHPVVRVSWEQAALYCNWLSKRASLPPVYEQVGDRVVAVKPLATGYRLPTEAEWAWAARYADGQNAVKYPWGDRLPVPPDAGNFADESASALLSGAIEGYNDGYPVTAPVDSFEPNALGLFNMGGNVAEWVHDLYGVYSPEPGNVEVDPLGAEDGELHVIRGSGWMDASVSELRLTYRDYGKDRRPDVGFRIARYAE